ncbi:hypothetical protein LPJ59_006034 [Coemansia sp. RSA 2399]|nr:hypothetical protein LPJ59_006034 [Coemansia sp. RSA 2399]
MATLDLDERQHIPFPVATKVAAGIIDGVHTDVTVLGFSNCVVVLVTQLSAVGSVLHAVASSLSNQGHEGSSTNPFNDAESIVERLSSNVDIPVDIRFLLGNPAAASGVASLYQICAINITQRKLKRSPDDRLSTILETAA